MGKLPFEYIYRETLIKKESVTDPNLGCRPEERTVKELINYGVVNIDKPSGPTSHQTSDYVQKILNINKSGHSGTLDPGVSGVLPIALEKATRIVQTLLKAGKEYVCLMHIHKDVKEKDIKKTVNQFVGKIMQLPPIKSAVKRVEREREIYYIEILEIDEKDVLFKVGCEAGTYIRKLCLHPQTEILTKNGSVTATDFCLNPQTIYSFNKGKMIEKNPLHTQKLPSPSKLVKITMSSGVSMIVTPDHEMLVSRRDGYKMIEAKELSYRDYLVKSLKFPNGYKEYAISDLLDDDYLIPQREIIDRCKMAFISKYGSIRAMYRKLKLDRKAFFENTDYAITIKHLKLAGIYEKNKRKIKTFKTQKGSIIKMQSLNEDFFYLLGLIASDGNNTREKGTVRYTRLKFHNENEVLIDKFLETYKKLFPNFPISKKKVKLNLFELDTANSFAATIAASLGVRSPQKNSDLLPISDSHPRLIKAFLKGYFDGDGSVYYRKKNKTKGTHSRICLHTISCLDGKRLHKMLLKVGIANHILKRKAGSNNNYMYDVVVGNIAAEKKFIEEIGTNHPEKLERFKDIINLKYEAEAEDHYLIGFHFKEEIRRNKSNFNRMGGNLHRILKSNIPSTRGFYKRSASIVELPKLDDFIIEKIKSIKKIKGTGYVYDMTVPKTHNFLVETGFVSSNCYDIGKSLKVGAHMAELRRTKAGPFDESTLYTLHDLIDAYHYWKNEDNEKYIRKVIQPMENAISHLPKIWVVDGAVNSLCHGIDLKIPGISKLHDQIEKNDMVAIMTLKDELVALGTARLTTKQMMKSERGLAVKTEKVFMGEDSYKIKQ